MYAVLSKNTNELKTGAPGRFDRHHPVASPRSGACRRRCRRFGFSARAAKTPSSNGMLRSLGEDLDPGPGQRWTLRRPGPHLDQNVLGRLRGSSLSIIIIINPGLEARTALEHMLESVVSGRGKLLRTNFSATSRVTRATKLTQAASRHSYRWCSPPTRGSATTFAVGDGRCVTVLKLGVSLFSPKWQRSS